MYYYTGHDKQCSDGCTYMIYITIHDMNVTFLRPSLIPNKRFIFLLLIYNLSCGSSSSLSPPVSSSSCFYTLRTNGESWLDMKDKVCDFVHIHVHTKSLSYLFTFTPVRRINCLNLFNPDSIILILGTLCKIDVDTISR